MPIILDYLSYKKCGLMRLAILCFKQELILLRILEIKLSVSVNLKEQIFFTNVTKLSLGLRRPLCDPPDPIFLPTAVHCSTSTFSTNDSGGINAAFA